MPSSAPVPRVAYPWYKALCYHITSQLLLFHPPMMSAQAMFLKCNLFLLIKLSLTLIRTSISLACSGAPLFKPCSSNAWWKRDLHFIPCLLFQHHMMAPIRYHHMMAPIAKWKVLFVFWKSAYKLVFASWIIPGKKMWEIFRPKEVWLETKRKRPAILVDVRKLKNVTKGCVSTDILAFTDGIVWLKNKVLFDAKAQSDLCRCIFFS